MRVLNSPRFATANGSPRSAPHPRSERSATAMTVPWRRRSTATTRPSSFADPPDPGHGRASRTSSSRRSAGSTGTTPSVSTAPRRHPARRVRADVLCCPRPPRTAGGKQIARVSIRPRAVPEPVSGDPYWQVVRYAGGPMMVTYPNGIRHNRVRLLRAERCARRSGRAAGDRVVRARCDPDTSPALMD